MKHFIERYLSGKGFNIEGSEIQLTDDKVTFGRKKKKFLLPANVKE